MSESGLRLCPQPHSPASTLPRAWPLPTPTGPGSGDLIGKVRGDFGDGHGLWITPCRGVHTLGMRFPIDVIYLIPSRSWFTSRTGLRPWRFAPIRFRATSVLELPEHTLRVTGTTIGDELEIETSQTGDHQPA